MSMTGLEAFDRTVHRTNVWVCEGWDPSDKPLKQRHERELLAHIARELAEYDSEALARAVYKVMLRHVSEGEINEVKHAMAAELEELWS